MAMLNNKRVTCVGYISDQLLLAEENCENRTAYSRPFPVDQRPFLSFFRSFKSMAGQRDLFGAGGFVALIEGTVGSKLFTIPAGGFILPG